MFMITGDFMDDSRKMAAAVTAVIQYIKAEEKRRRQSPSALMNLWGLSGRQTQMQMRRQVQVKAVYGWKLR